MSAFPIAVKSGFFASYILVFHHLHGNQLTNSSISQIYSCHREQLWCLKMILIYIYIYNWSSLLFFHNKELQTSQYQ